MPAANKGTVCGLLARADDKAEGPAVGTDEFSLREGNSLGPSIGIAPEFDGCLDGGSDWPGTGEDSLIVDVCLLCDLDTDTEPDREPAIELESLRCLISRGRADMIGYSNPYMEVAVSMVTRCVAKEGM